MEESRFTEDQIAFALKQAASGIRVGEVYRKMDVSDGTFYAGRKKCGGLGPSALRRLRQLKEESRKFKQIAADFGPRQGDAAGSRRK